jgi:hypothetical protein
MDNTIVVALIGAASTVAAALIGVERGSRGKKKIFEQLETELKLDNTSWRGEAEDVGDGDTPAKLSGLIKFRQFGSRIVGEALSADEGREWLVEGIAYKGRLCYVYVDKDPNVTSIGTASFELNPAGDKLLGQWIGWSPDGSKSEPRKATLVRAK